MWDFMWESHPKLTKIRVFHPKHAKSKLKQIKYLNNIRRIGNSGVLTENPRVPSSTLGLGTRRTRGYVTRHNPLFYFEVDDPPIWVILK
jgi:hypothetical protein